MPHDIDICSMIESDVTLAEELGATLCYAKNAPSCCFTPFPENIYILSVCHSTISVIGMILNLLTVISLSYARLKSTDMHSTLHSPVTPLIINLSLCDFSYCCIIIIQAIGYPTWVKKKSFCKFSSFGIWLSMGSSFLTLGMIAINRCIAVWRPTLCKKLFNRWKGFQTVFFIWVISFVVCTPTHFELYGAYGYAFDLKECNIVPVNGKSAIYMMICIVLAILFIVVLPSSVLIFIKVRISRATIVTMGDVAVSTVSQIEKRERKLGILLLLVCLSFSLLVAPILIGILFPLSTFWKFCLEIPYSLHFDVNFFIYIIWNSGYRQAYVILFSDLRTFICAIFHCK